MTNDEFASAVSVDAVTHGYGARRRLFGFGRAAQGALVLRDVTLAFPTHSVNVILGLNGAGKSTLLKILAGVMAPQSGAVALHGKPVSPVSRGTQSDIGLAIGNRSRLQWDLAPIETFRLHRAIYGLSRASFARTLKELEACFAIGDLMQRPTRTLSLGQRVRIEVALAMLHRPRLLLLDECSIGLDLLVKTSYHAALAHIARDWGTCVVQATNDLADLTENTHKIAILSDCRIVFDGTFRELTALPGFSRAVTVSCAEQDIEALHDCLRASGLQARRGDDGALSVQDGDRPGLKELVLDCVRQSAPSVRSVQFGAQEDLKTILAQLETASR